MIEGARYVKGQKRTTAPVRLLVAVPEFHHAMQAIDDGDYYYNARYVWYTEGRRYGTRWVGSDEPKRLHPDDWWEYVYSKVPGRVRLYVVAPNAGDFLTCTGFWHQMERGRFALHRCGDGCRLSDRGSVSHDGGWNGRLVLGGPPDIVHVSCNDGSVCIVSLRNYTTASWEELYHCVAMGGEPGKHTGYVTPDTYECPVQQCTTSTRYVRNLVSGWVRNDCGAWKETAAQLSVSWWRKSFYTERVCRHGCTDAVELERQAGYGGRNEVWFVGDVGSADSVPDGSEVIPEPSCYPTIQTAIHRCDVTSQYPALLAAEQFPVRLVGVCDNISVADLEAFTRYYGVIADVTIRTERPEYPYRRASEPSYPVGKFDTILVGPELQSAIERGEVVRVRKAAYYQMGRPLSGYAAHLLRERLSARERGDGVSEQFVKALSTAIGGKFAQRGVRRAPNFNVVSPAYRWGPWDRINPDLTVTRFVLIAGVAFEEVPAAGGSKLLSAVYAFLTAYGRSQMAAYREAIYPCRPFAQCTDGIWLGDTALSTLRRRCGLEPRTPGKLRLESVHSYARWFTPCHYYIDGKWILSGYRHGARVETDLSVTEFRDTNPVRTCPFKPPMALKRIHIKRTLAGLSVGGTVGPDGWVSPKVLNGRY